LIPKGTRLLEAYDLAVHLGGEDFCLVLQGRGNPKLGDG
jgi:hypothetical protein